VALLLFFQFKIERAETLGTAEEKLLERAVDGWF
jgi:hypothetical protein